ncbi:hypothetical protein GCM10009641_45170 [Mycobacterium cookii]|uniref:Uncharacterized protein n=1 Tax=Nocardioides furvisabuli TaxID=375542 RepID=A0ABP5JFX6_9ACTN|nr:hypothetical protein [Nocardioides furvisabuli]
MDLSALIFVALAVAWAVYLIPKALKHHDEVVRSRSVEKFSHTMRVLARREPVDRRNARLVVSPIRAALRPPVETKARVSAPAAPAPTAPTAAPVARRTPPQVERASARRAARRRRNVLALLVLANAVVITLAATSITTWWWVAAPATLLLAWLVACRVSVRAERRRRTPRSAIEIGLPPQVDDDDVDLTGEMPLTPPLTPPLPRTPAAPSCVDETPAHEVPAVVTEPAPVLGGWDMVPATLPTYVGKPAAQRRTVSTIDLDSTGVWSSGHSDSDSAIARSAEESARTAREADEARRASGA